MTKFRNLWTEVFEKKSVEPVMSTRDRSVREMKYGPRHIMHRFPIPGGISLLDLLGRNVAQNNSLLARLKEKKDGVEG